jgi:Nucleotide-diphospho-sugar transferase
MLAQDDGLRVLVYAPYYANSGFFFAKFNPRTKYFFERYLTSAGYIDAWGSDQAVFNAVLPEVVSFAGLTVKTLGYINFPSGRTYQDPGYFEYMRDIASQTLTPTIYHMNWTNNKTQKVVQMKQMGMWFLNQKGDNMTCASRPEIECSHWNKPSMKICATAMNMTRDDTCKFVKITTRFWPEEASY